MKLRLRKLLAVTVPALAALAISPGTASASWYLQPYCSSGFTLTPSSLQTLKYDANNDGFVCVFYKQNGNVKDNGYLLLWRP